MEHETLVQVCARLSKLGYTVPCRAEAKGMRLKHDNRLIPAQEIKVDDVIRLEGTSAPSESVMVFALSGQNPAWRATYCVTHGPELAAEDAAMVQALNLRGASRAGVKTS